MTNAKQEPEENSWIDKWVERAQNDSDTSYHSDGIGVPYPDVYDELIKTLPADMAPLFKAYIQSLLKREQSDD